jgi:hypothetical protein
MRVTVQEVREDAALAVGMERGRREQACNLAHHQKVIEPV